MSKLVIFLPDAGEVTHELTQARITVGRTEDNDICISDASVSTHHAEIVLVGGKYTLRDLGSTNGMRINGKPAVEAELTPGDRLRFGSVEGVYEPDAAPRSSEPLPPQEEALPATQSQRPSDFGNASPFAKRKAAAKDPVKTAAMAAGIVALAACAVGIVMSLLL